MIKVFLAAGVAALALTAPAAAQDNKRGDRASEQKTERAKAQKARSADRKAVRTERAARSDDRRSARAERTERRQVQRATAQPRQERAERRQAVVQQREQRVERGEARQQQVQRVDRVEQRAQRVERQQRGAERVNARERQIARVANRDDRQILRLDARRDRQLERIANRNQRQLARIAETRVVPLSEWNDLARGGVWLNGCPPGLARKPVACVPPGQVKNLVGQPLSVLSNRIALQPLPNRLRFAYADTDDYYYRYGNGYMYRVDRDDDLISALLPLFGLGLTTGQMFPTAYSNSYLPTGLQPFYANSRCGYSAFQDDYYRYANGYVYEVDCRTGLIEDVDPMLGYGYGFGQMMPLTYSAYNVPYQYRPLYYDTSDSYYRYAPGAIYQVDPTTSLITAVAALLGGGLNVGQPMPLGYSAYNVPYQYRTTYFDTPNDWYRYSNGYVYRVDPRTQLVSAIVASALT
jgi:hypothetical protein